MWPSKHSGVDTCSAFNDNKASLCLGVVRVKPLGAGAGGGEASSVQAIDEGVTQTVAFDAERARVTVDGREFTYPSHVIAPDMSQEQLYDAFMPPRVTQFLEGVDVNIMAYGQTGSGKTHTMFGPPGIMAEAGAGKFGDDVNPNYGLFPRGLLDVVNAVAELNRGDKRAVLTASVVELGMAGNVDLLLSAAEMKARSKNNHGTWVNGAVSLGVALDKAPDPPRLYGMTELTLESPSDTMAVFAGLATRNTAATLMNDSSSRSHCMAFLTLRVYNPGADTVRTSRFQFVDLAGCERMEDAHGQHITMDWSDPSQLTGLMTNFSLLMLSACVRELLEFRKKKSNAGKKFSTRLYMVDLVPLLQKSMTGEASTACFVNISQAPKNLIHSKFALDFGETFSKLTLNPKPTRPQACVKIVKAAEALKAEATKALDRANGKKNDRFVTMRQAQVRDCDQILAILNTLREVRT